MQFKLKMVVVVSDALILPLSMDQSFFYISVEKSRYAGIELLFHLKIHWVNHFHFDFSMCITTTTKWKTRRRTLFITHIEWVFMLIFITLTFTRHIEETSLSSSFSFYFIYSFVVIFIFHTHTHNTRKNIYQSSTGLDLGGSQWFNYAN